MRFKMTIQLIILSKW